MRGWFGILPQTHAEFFVVAWLDVEFRLPLIAGAAVVELVRSAVRPSSAMFVPWRRVRLPDRELPVAALVQWRQLLSRGRPEWQLHVRRECATASFHRPVTHSNTPRCPRRRSSLSSSPNKLVVHPNRMEYPYISLTFDSIKWSVQPILFYWLTKNSSPKSIISLVNRFFAFNNRSVYL